MKLPVIVIHDFMKFSKEEIEIMKEDALFSYEKALDDDQNAYKTNVRLIRDRSENFFKLYQKFLKKSEEFFGKLSLIEENSTACHCLFQNCDFWDFNPHIHDNCDINSVYYLKVPQKNRKYCGPIVFSKDPNSEKWEQYQPRPDDMLIFPGDLWHDPLFTEVSEWRISVNMEIQCENPPTWSDYDINKS